MKKILSVLGVSVLLTAALSAPALADDTIVEPVPVVESVVETAPEPEPVVAEEIIQSQTKTEHIEVSFCHKPGEHNQQTLTTDDDGFLQGHLGHGDSLGECTALPPEEPAFVPYGASARWLIPATWNYNVTPSYQAAIFPQAVLTGDVPACQWSQDDEYWLENPAEVALFESLDDDGVLIQGEDAAIYKSHVFTAGPPCEEEPPTYAPTCTTVTGTDTTLGSGFIEVAGEWESRTIALPIDAGLTLADIGTVFDVTATQTQYLGLHIDLGNIGTIVFEEEPSYGGNLWSTATWQGVEPGMGYNAFGSIEDFIELNGNAEVFGIDVLYTSPVASNTVVDRVTIACTTWIFDNTPPTEEPTPTPTPTEPTPTPTETPVVVAHPATPAPTVDPVVAEVFTPSGTLAATGSSGVEGLAVVAGILVLLGAAIAIGSVLRRRANATR